MKHVLLWLLLVSVPLVSCVSTKSPQATLDSIVHLMDTGKAAELTRLSSIPFLLDGETVNRPEDIELFWTAVAERGIQIGTLSEVTSQAASKASRSVFGDRVELRSFFAKYVDPDAQLVLAKSAGGKQFAFVFKDKGASLTLYAFKGPY